MPEVADIDVELEQRLLKTCIEDPSALDAALDMVKDGIFGIPEHQAIWGLLCDIVNDGKIVSPEQVLSRQAALSERGRKALALIMQGEPTRNLENTICVLHEHMYRRRIKDSARELYNRATKGTIRDIDHLLSSMQDYSGTIISGYPRGILSPMQVVATHMDEIQNELTGKRDTVLASCGIASVDEMEYNFDGHRMMVLLGGTGHGKTRFSVQFACETARLYKRKNHDRAVIVFIYESGVKAWLKLILSRLGMIPTGYFKHNAWDLIRRHGYSQKLEDAMEEYKSLNIFLTDTVSSIAQLERNVARFSSVNGLRPGLIIIDYVQLLSGDPSLSDVKQLEDIAQRLQDLANQHECHVLALSQLTKQPGGEVTPKWARAIADNATLVLKLVRASPEEHVLFCEKNRVNALWSGGVYLEADPSMCMYKDVEREEVALEGWV